MNRPYVVALMLAASLSGCGGYSAPTAPTGSGQMSNPPPPGSMTVTIQDFSFSPATLTIKAGTIVHWKNNGPSAHTTTSDAGTWDSGALSSSGGTFDFTFTQAGTYSYHCSLHPPTLYPNFTGTITVTP